MAAEPRDEKRLRILIVEDDRIASHHLQSTLERQGHEVTGIAETGGEALEIAASKPSDLALVDIRLRGETDGIAAARALNEERDVAVVFLTGYSSDEVFGRAREARPAGYLRKPFSDGELSACLEAAAARSHARERERPPAEPEGDGEEESGEAEIPDGRPDPAVRAPALARARELSRRESFRELLGFRRTEGEEESGDGEEDERIAEPAGTAAPGAGLIDEIADPLLALDEQWRITYANAEALAYFGGKSALIGRDFWDGFDPRSRERYQEEFTRPLSDGNRHTFEFHDSERDHWLEVNAYRGGGGGLLALFRDVSVRKQAEADQLRVQRLEGLGLLARGFAHDFNNLLTVLIGNLDFAKIRFPNDAEFQEEMRNAENAASHARNLVLQLLTFAQGGRPIREPTRVADLLRQVLEERRRDHPRVRYQFQCADPNLRVSLDRGQIRRLVQNLVTNAEQGMIDRGGALIARCSIAGSEEVGRWNGKPFPAEEEHLVVEIIDTGRGMSEAELDRAFEPYFTTRKDANATGIGLTVCESIAKAHDGFVLLQSKEGRGTIATFCMPVGPPSWADDNADETAMIRDTASFSFAGGAAIPVGSARILILEDEPQIRKLISMTLQKDGHEVVETADGRETVRRFKEAMEAGRPFDLILSDLTIEDGLGGVDTIRALRRLDSGVVAIVSSGYSDAPAMARPAEFGFTAVLPKPYPPRELSNLVNRVLSGGVRHPGGE